LAAALDFRTDCDREWILLAAEADAEAEAACDLCWGKDIDD